MQKNLSHLVGAEAVQDFRMFLYELWHGENSYLLNNDIVLAFERYCEQQEKALSPKVRDSILELLRKTPELIIFEEVALLMHRHQMARYALYKISIHGNDLEEISVRAFLEYRDRYINPELQNSHQKLRLDFLPFYDYGPNIRDVKSIGRGVEFLNKHMSSGLFQDPEKWNARLFDFLKIHSLGEQQLLLAPDVSGDYRDFQKGLEKMVQRLDEFDGETGHGEVMPLLRRHGFEPGWGNTAGRIRETMQLLLDLFHAPDAQTLEHFISRIPMISRIAVISPHGWFGQENVLGKPDTGGQVVYILDQVRALERSLTARLTSYGLSIAPKIIILTRLIPDSQGTTCHVRLEKIHHTENAYILRVPFTDAGGNIVSHWISRFKLWPYLERFAHDARIALQSELAGKPDLIIGNYSDGNLVATLLADQMDVTQCNIAHALEKNKYLFSDLRWPDFEQNYHFSVQFIADLIAMNMADFIITSTFQEIAGTAYSGGQYESYLFFTMPGLLQVENGVNLMHPKFNVIPPGVDESNYFPPTEHERRLENQRSQLEHLLFYEQNESIVGRLENPEKPPIFTMARLDHNKNITGLVESFGQSQDLQELSNLIVIAGNVDPGRSSDAEEIEEIHRMHALIDQYNLRGKIRWLGLHLPKEDAGEVYRIIADHRGVFVQPGRFEGFGLTVLEAMVSGLPTFATHFGGPSEIIIHGESGFLINPTVPELISKPVVEFLRRVRKDASHWQKLSEAGIERVRRHFTWQLYSEKLLNLTALYGFWRYSVSNVGKRELALYCHLLFHLFYKERVREIDA